MDTEKAKPKQIKLSKHTAAAIRAAMEQVNTLAIAARGAQAAFEGAAAVHGQHVNGIVQDAGFQPEEFAHYGLWEEDGKVFLRAR